MAWVQTPKEGFDQLIDVLERIGKRLESIDQSLEVIACCRMLEKVHEEKPPADLMALFRRYNERIEKKYAPLGEEEKQ